MYISYSYSLNLFKLVNDDEDNHLNLDLLSHCNLGRRTDPKS